MGFPIYTWINITFQNFDPKEQKKFQEYLLHHKNVTYISKVTGKYNYMIAICAKDLEHFEKIFGEILHRFSYLIKEYDTCAILEEYKFEYMVDLIEEEKKQNE